MGAPERKKLNVGDLECLRRMCGLVCMDRVKNEEVQRKTGLVRELAD